MASEEFYHDFLILKPDKGGVYDLLHLLSSHRIDENPFTDCPRGTQIPEFRQRKIIFISVILQKLLLFLERPMACFGYLFEMLLNLDVVAIFRNLIRGKLVLPDPASKTFKSAAAILDNRFMLDQTIMHGDDRYNGYLSVMASKLCYENAAFIENTVVNQWKVMAGWISWGTAISGTLMHITDFQEKHSTHAFMFREKRDDYELIVVAFRGTAPFDAVGWSTDVDLSFYELPKVGKVHAGFMKALGLQKTGWPKEIVQGDNDQEVAYYTIREILRKLLTANEKARFILTGHSLGGALAVLFALILPHHEENWMFEKLAGIYTFGQPRIGNEKFGKYMETHLSARRVPYVRSVYCNDFVPRIPYDNSADLYRHFGGCLYYDSLYKGMVLEEEPNKNYFSLIMAIPMKLNAVWELVRSFVIPCLKGPYYRESLLMMAYRVLGLIFPGLPAHATTDYVNSTTLGSPILPLKTTNLSIPYPKLD